MNDIKFEAALPSSEVKEDRMPEVLKTFLQGLEDEDAKALWVWLDETPESEWSMITTLALSHNALSQAMTAKIKECLEC